MNLAHAVLACVLLMTGAASARAAQETTPDTAPDTAPLDGVIDRLILQLADPDVATRESASQRLRDMGKAALPALKQAASDPDPEIRSRAAALVRRLEHRPLPGGPLDRGQPHDIQHIRFDGNTITVEQGDRRFEIVKEDGGGIRIIVTATVDGQRVTETYTASDAAELRELEPEAYRVYERWGNMPFAAGGAFEIRAGQIVIGNRMAPMPVHDELGLLREQLQAQMRRRRVPADKMQDVLSQLQKLQAARQGGVAGIRAQPEAQINEYFRLSDALRKTLAELKLDPGDGEALPPPPSQRLGVQITLNADPFNNDIDGVRVQMVAPDSRAARIGLQEGDLIRKIDQTPILSTAAIRKALADAKGPIVLHVVRDGRTIQLTEKPEAKQ